MSTTLNPYLSFRDTASEAIEFYRSVFGGTVTKSTFGEFGMGDGAAEAHLVMHSQLDSPSGFTLMASDTPSQMGKPSANGTVSLSGDDEDELRGYWNSLAEGGSIGLPLETSPWGAVFGQLTDRFGVSWMVNIGG